MWVGSRFGQEFRTAHQDRYLASVKRITARWNVDPSQRRVCPEPTSIQQRLTADIHDLVESGRLVCMSEPEFPMYNSRPASGVLTCPKCAGAMQTYVRNGIQLEQCQACRGIFLDFGELEQMTQVESRLLAQQAPPPAGYPQSYGPAWGERGGHKYRRKGLSGMFFSS